MSHRIFIVPLFCVSLVAARLAFAEDPAGAKTPVEVKDVAGVENVFRISPQLYSGGTPSAAVGFKSLAKLGVKTIVSVDGARPAVDAARQSGLQYVHIPIGYDGVSGDACKSLTTVMRKLPGPVFIHCHHGKHRGPAAAAIAAIAAGTHDEQSAMHILKSAGTGASYGGLWRDVRQFKKPPASMPAVKLQSYVPPQPMAKIMVAIAGRFEKIVAAQKTGWPADAAGRKAAAQLAFLLAEDFRELQRSEAAGDDEDFEKQLDATLDNALLLNKSLTDNKLDAATQAYTALRKNCNQCHADHRN